MKRVEKPLLYFNYNQNCARIGLMFEDRNVELFCAENITFDEAVKKYKSIAKSLGIKIKKGAIMKNYCDMKPLPAK
jgi:hypothetical protein